MKNLVLSLFLIFSFAVQGFGSDTELSIQKSGKCFEKLRSSGDEAFYKCFEDLNLNCASGDDCSDCLASIYINIVFMTTYPDNNKIFKERIDQLLEYKSDTCPSLKENTIEMLTILEGKNKK